MIETAAREERGGLKGKIEKMGRIRDREKRM